VRHKYPLAVEQVLARGRVEVLVLDHSEGEGGVAHREDLAATASATLERSAGTVAHGKRAATLQGLAPPARRPRAAGAPWEARARAARVQT